MWGIHPAIDFTGGTLLEIQSSKFNPPAGGQNPTEEIKNTVEKENIGIGSIQKSGEDTYLLRLKPIDNSQNQKLQDELKRNMKTLKKCVLRQSVRLWVRKQPKTQPRR